MDSASPGIDDNGVDVESAALLSSIGEPFANIDQDLDEAIHVAKKIQTVVTQCRALLSFVAPDTLPHRRLEAFLLLPTLIAFPSNQITVFAPFFAKSLGTASAAAMQFTRRFGGPSILASILANVQYGASDAFPRLQVLKSTSPSGDEYLEPAALSPDDLRLLIEYLASEKSRLLLSDVTDFRGRKLGALQPLIHPDTPIVERLRAFAEIPDLLFLNDNTKNASPPLFHILRETVLHNICRSQNIRNPHLAPKVMFELDASHPLRPLVDGMDPFKVATTVFPTTFGHTTDASQLNAMFLGDCMDDMISLAHQVLDLVLPGSLPGAYPDGYILTLGVQLPRTPAKRANTPKVASGSVTNSPTLSSRGTTPYSSRKRKADDTASNSSSSIASIADIAAVASNALSGTDAEIPAATETEPASPEAAAATTNPPPAKRSKLSDLSAEDTEALNGITALSDLACAESMSLATGPQASDAMQVDPSQSATTNDISNNENDKDNKIIETRDLPEADDETDDDSDHQPDTNESVDSEPEKSKPAPRKRGRPRKHHSQPRPRPAPQPVTPPGPLTRRQLQLLTERPRRAAALNTVKLIDDGIDSFLSPAKSPKAETKSSRRPIGDDLGIDKVAARRAYMKAYRESRAAAAALRLNAQNQAAGAAAPAAADPNTQEPEHNPEPSPSRSQMTTRSSIMSSPKPAPTAVSPSRASPAVAGPPGTPYTPLSVTKVDADAEAIRALSEFFAQSCKSAAIPFDTLQLDKVSRSLVSEGITREGLLLSILDASTPSGLASFLQSKKIVDVVVRALVTHRFGEVGKTLFSVKTETQTTDDVVNQCVAEFELFFRKVVEREGRAFDSALQIASRLFSEAVFKHFQVVGPFDLLEQINTSCIEVIELRNLGLNRRLLQLLEKELQHSNNSNTSITTPAVEQNEWTKNLRKLLEPENSATPAKVEEMEVVTEAAPAAPVVEDEVPAQQQEQPVATAEEEVDDQSQEENDEAQPTPVATEAAPSHQTPVKRKRGRPRKELSRRVVPPPRYRHREARNAPYSQHAPRPAPTPRKIKPTPRPKQTAAAEAAAREQTAVEEQTLPDAEVTTPQHDSQAPVEQAPLVHVPVEQVPVEQVPVEQADIAPTPADEATTTKTEPAV